MTTSTVIDEYTVLYSSGTFRPRIWLYSGGKAIGQLYFETNGSALPQDQIIGTPTIFYHREDFANVLDMLRNEKPVVFDSDGSRIK